MSKKQLDEADLKPLPKYLGYLDEEKGQQILVVFLNADGLSIGIPDEIDGQIPPELAKSIIAAVSYSVQRATAH